VPQLGPDTPRIKARDCGTVRSTRYQTQSKDDVGWFVRGEYDSLDDARAAYKRLAKPFVSRIVRVVAVITHEVTW